ncbi:MAG: hypothetical protein ACTHQ3_03890 [Motilibacteraceae bacterium]
MLSDLWPTYALRITTPRLQLRLPTEPEIVQLADVAAAGVHGPDERPFLTPWTEGAPLERARIVLRWHWEALADWSVDDWSLGPACSPGTVGRSARRACAPRTSRWCAR